MDTTKMRTWAEVDLSALEHNYRALRAMLPAGCRFLGVCKANAYGHGAVPVAKKLEEAFSAKGIPMLHHTLTNQQFPILTKAQRDKLEEKYAFSFWQPMDEDRAAVRFCTSWATREEDVDALVADIQSL